MINFISLHSLLDQLKQKTYRHITVSPATHQVINARSENAMAKNIRDVLGWSRPFTQGAIKPALFDLMQAAQILQPANVNQKDAWRSQIRISTIDELYFIHSAYPTTQSDAIFFGPDTYRFINALKHYFSIPIFSRKTLTVNRAVDICTGCGPAAIQIAKLFPQAEVYGVDINDAALEFAQFNARVNQTKNVRFMHSNLLQDVEGEFDFITANPPYLVDATKRAYRHGGGVYGYQLSLDILDSAIQRLKPGGTLLLYTGVTIVDGKDLFYEEVASKLSATEFNYKYEEIDPDIFAGELLCAPYDIADRIAAIVLTVHKPVNSNRSAKRKVSGNLKKL